MGEKVGKGPPLHRQFPSEALLDLYVNGVLLLYFAHIIYRPRDVGLEDTERVHYMNLYINEVLKAIEVDHVNVMGYFASSLMDGFEWSSGKILRTFVDPNSLSSSGTGDMTLPSTDH